jgi:hypothetical protein
MGAGRFTKAAYPIGGGASARLGIRMAPSEWVRAAAGGPRKSRRSGGPLRFSMYRCCCCCDCCCCWKGGPLRLASCGDGILLFPGGAVCRRSSPLCRSGSIDGRPP